jgi:hypothetical protein
MRPSNLLRNDGQRAIALALVLEPVFMDEDGVPNSTDALYHPFDSVH